MMSLKNPSALAVCICAALLTQACKDSGTPAPTPGVGGSYLHVSVPDFYFGTRDVGTQATQQIEIANRGGDVYPIRNLTVTGANADEFTTDFYDEIVLNPTEAIKLNVTFTPITTGRKEAELDVDFDTIKQVSEAANQNEQHFYRAVELEKKQEYKQSLVAYDSYMDGGPVTSNKRKAAIKAPVIKESQLYGDGPDFELYLLAMDARENGQYDEAMIDVNLIQMLHPDSYIADDAVYLRGYIELMDKKDFNAAKETMKQLRQNYPESSYYDTALYSEAMAHEELGNRQLARSIYEDLRYKHTGVEALGISFSKDNIVSRMWFDRASAAIEALDS